MKKIILIIFILLLSAKTKNECINLELHKKELFTYQDYLDIRYEEYLSNKLDTIFTVISYVESTFNPMAFNPVEDAAGILQIRPIMVAEVNQIIGYNKFTLEDRWDKHKSFKMFKIYQDFVNPEYDEELAARFWNGGRTGDKKRSTDIYVDKYQLRKNQFYSEENLLVNN